MNGAGPLKVRIGFGLGTRTTIDGAGLRALAGALEELGFDSLWLSERIGAPAPDPVVGMAYAAGATERLKLGMSVMVLPGRNPVLVAKALASLDHLSGGRLLPAFGLGIADPHEQQAFGVSRAERARLFDEALPLIRRLWTGEPVTHHGERYHLEGVRVLPRPVGRMQVWLGGIAPSELRRTGRLGDGWLPSFCVPADVAAGIAEIGRVAAEEGRSIEPDHYGALVAFADRGPLPPELDTLVRRRRPGLSAADVIPVGLEALRTRLVELMGAGASKFVVVPLTEPASWRPWLDDLAEAVLDLQHA